MGHGLRSRGNIAIWLSAQRSPLNTTQEVSHDAPPFQYNGPAQREDPMTETIRRVDYFYVTAPNKPGEAFRMLSTLQEAGVNLLAFSGFPSGRRSQLDFVPEDPAAFRKVARKAGWTLSPRKTGFLIEGNDEPGAFLHLVSRLAEAKINVTAATAVARDRNAMGHFYGSRPRMQGKGAKVLGIKKPATAPASGK